ncbi:MAG: hypothetical protein KAH01_00805 [Caldisericia bacterium]|nr:hypothetical protein [Caldisericia bacterium]
MFRNGETFQKVAEFNSGRKLYESLELKAKVLEISELRNKRIDFTAKDQDLDDYIYHCVGRSDGKFLLFEEHMDKVDIQTLKIINEKRGNIHFKDCKNEYRFNNSKSTLFKKFHFDSFKDIEVEILENPLEMISTIQNQDIFKNTVKTKYLGTIYLPLYGSKGTVELKSSLNQWNASGRKRKSNEAYIPVQASIRKRTRSFSQTRTLNSI